MSGKKNDILLPLPERRDIERIFLKTVIKICTESVCGDCFRKIAVCCRNKSEINRAFLFFSQPSYFFLLEHAQYLCLYIDIHITDFIEKNSAIVCLLEKAGMIAVGTGK